ncbi:hypothetical protein [Burkholderia gladioli]|uniref:hypothetical protein n=1 Tax=Burkholderia gladioli TaxID=28095 RepID=UPI0011D2C780|nr:hypothetical protein [Burkholderia gladioli]MBW5282278.1 hypothetical protein [Burkholderia gladioli]
MRAANSIAGKTSIGVQGGKRSYLHTVISIAEESSAIFMTAPRRAANRHAVKGSNPMISHVATAQPPGASRLAAAGDPEFEKL